MSFLFFSCTQEKNIPTENYIYQIEDGGSPYPVPFTAQEISLRFSLSSTKYWSVRLFDSDKEIYSTVYYQNDTLPILLFDSLEVKEYTLQFNSEFNDSIQTKIFVNSRKEIRLSEELSNYYLESKFDKSILSNFSKKDTIQLFYKNTGCFGGARREFNIYYNLDNLVISEKDSLVTITNFEKRFEEFISEGTDVEEKYKGGRCTSTSAYAIKIKKELFIIIDNSCQWNGLDKLLGNNESLF